MDNPNPSTSVYTILFPVIICAVAVVYLRSFLDWSVRSRGLPLPPGPKPLPIAGNVFGIPNIKPWLGFRDMSKVYGNLVYLRVFGQSLLVIGDAELAHELLDKRSANTSDRPMSPVIQLSGQDLNVGLFPYGLRWRQHRREFWQFFNPSVVAKYHPVQLTEAHKFIDKLLKSPQRSRDHIQHLFTRTIIKVVYGIDIVDENDERIVMPHAALDSVRKATPGRFAVEMFPFLRYVPSWFPGAGFQKIFAESKRSNDYLKHALFDETKAALERDESRPCVLARMLARAQAGKSEPVDSETEEMLKNVCATAVDGGADTTFSTLSAIFVAMTLYPDVQRKAQAVLDAVVGPDRLPDFGDSDALAYIHAIVKETFRWHVVAPLGIAHKTVHDDEFRGYFIPAGTIILPNAWAMLHDPEVYPGPDEFRPERFLRDGRLDPTVPDPTSYALGFGRRICAGRYFAFPSLFITTACVLHVFDIGPPLDADGKPMPTRYEQTHGILTYPEDCRCTITPRSEGRKELVLAAAREIDGM